MLGVGVRISDHPPPGVILNSKYSDQWLFQGSFRSRRVFEIKIFILIQEKMEFQFLLHNQVRGYTFRLDYIIVTEHHSFYLKNDLYISFTLLNLELFKYALSSLSTNQIKLDAKLIFVWDDPEPSKSIPWLNDMQIRLICVGYRLSDKIVASGALTVKYPWI